VSAAIVVTREAVYLRLHRLSTQAAVRKRPRSGAADYEGKLLSANGPVQQPRASAEAELLDDPGRIRSAPRSQDGDCLVRAPVGWGRV
jgi:hypothetical protein